MQRWAVCVIERAYLTYKFRSRIPGLCARLRERQRRREMAVPCGPMLMKKFLNPPRRQKSRLSEFGRIDSRKSVFIPRQEHPIMRVAVPREFEIKQKAANREQDLIIRTNRMNEAMSQNTKRKFITDSSLYYLEHDSVIVLGGIDVHHETGVGKNTGKDMYRFVPHENNWEYVGELPAPRTHHNAVYFLGRIYVVGGADPREDDSKGKFVVVDTVWSMEPVRKVWFNEGSLNVRRKNFGLVACGKYLFAIGGQDKSYRVTDTVERYDPDTGIWEFAAPLRCPRMGIACTKFEDKIWIGGGMCGSSQKPLTDSVECYDLETNQWTEVTKLRVPRCFASFFIMSDNLYVIAGAGKNNSTRNNTVSFKSIDIWNRDEEIWEEHAEMEVARHGHTTASLGTQIMIIGGVTTVYMRSLSSVECFCVTRGSWIRGLSTLPLCLSGHATVTLPPATAL